MLLFWTYGTCKAHAERPHILTIFHSHSSQKRPDVHKIVLSINLRSPTPPPGKGVNFEDFLLICTGFPHFGPFSRGVNAKFCGQEFYGHPNFSDLGPKMAAPIFLGAWDFWPLSAGKKPIKFPFQGGGGFGVLVWGGGKCQFYFDGRGWRGDFSPNAMIA